jgi:hypothetical protein
VALQVECVLWTAVWLLRNRCADPAELNRCMFPATGMPVLAARPIAFPTKIVEVTSLAEHWIDDNHRRALSAADLDSLPAKS